ncbi:MAG: type II secretion system protein [Phycisphaeraceae bacterium]
MMACRRGLTLIEVMAVVALMGLAAGATAWSMAGDVSRNNRQATITRIEYADRMARIAADRMGQRCVLRFDIDAQQLRRVMTDAAGDEQASHTLALPRECRLDRVVRSGDSCDSGQTEIAYSTGGRSASYAARLTFERDKESVWLVFAGLTGQVVIVHDEQEAEKLFENLATGWTDAD